MNCYTVKIVVKDETNNDSNTILFDVEAESIDEATEKIEKALDL